VRKARSRRAEVGGQRSEGRSQKAGVSSNQLPIQLTFHVSRITFHASRLTPRFPPTTNLTTNTPCPRRISME
jgi:hypothetical protein